MSPMIDLRHTCIVSIGNDLIEIDRIRALVQKYERRFLEHIYTAEELDYCFRQTVQFNSLAARFAAKEATAKALRVGIGRHLHWRSIAVSNDTSGAPSIHLDFLGKQALANLGGKRLLLSISHTKSLAQAIVLITG